MSLIASAPGKLHLAGEYAVLDGAEAVVCAVDRRAIARATPGAPPSASEFLAALVEVIVAREGDGDAAAIARTIAVDTAQLCDGAIKLGLGSSAAATVAACACALAQAGGAIDRDEVHAIARAAHALAQGRRGARGSGADVAAAIHGGLIAVTLPTLRGDPPQVRRLVLPDLVLIPFWTGRPADTASLVTAVAAATGRPGVDAALTDIAHASAALVVASTPDPRAVALGSMTPARRTAAAIAAIAAGGAAIAALAAAAGVELEPPVVAAARRIAGPAGGAVKTTGAGGGDVAILVAPPGADEAGLRAAIAAAGARPLDLRIDPRGVDIEPREE